MEIKTARKQDIPELVRLAGKLWPDADALDEEFGAILDNSKEIVYLMDQIAFAHFTMRHDYVNGSTTSPVGYLEGIYVEKAYRQRGVASKLIRKGEAWAKTLGASEMASDVFIDNKSSMVFHEKYGFKEAEKVVCYIKKIRSEENE